MTENEIKNLLELVKAGRVSPNTALKRLRDLPFEDLGFAKIDHHRSLRKGYAEVIFAPGKRPEQVVKIVKGMLKQSGKQNILITRGDKKLYTKIKRAAKTARFHELSGVVTIRRDKKIYGKGLVLIVSAGTSDIPVAEEAAVTAELMGNRVATLYDVGESSGLVKVVGKDRYFAAEGVGAVRMVGERADIEARIEQEPGGVLAGVAERSSDYDRLALGHHPPRFHTFCLFI